MFREACDKCPGRAQVRVGYESGGCLYFCAHHLNAYYPHGEHPGVTFTYATVEV